MDKTPTKTSVSIVLTPSTKQSTCVLCGEKIQNVKERHKLINRSGKTEYFFLIEKTLQIKISEEGHSDVCCRRCIRKLTTIDRSISQFKETYALTREKLKLTHGRRTTKRQPESTGPSSSRRIVIFDARNAEDDDQINTLEDLSIDDEHFMDSFRYGNDTDILEEIKKRPELYEIVKDSIFKSLEDEVKNLCSKHSDRSLQHVDKDALQTFSFKNLDEKWRKDAAIFHRFLQCSINRKSEARNQRKTLSDVLAAQVSAGCKLLHIFNRDMKALLHIQDAILLKGGLKKSGFHRLQSTGDCHSYQTCISFADKLAGLWDTELCAWQRCLAVEANLEIQLLQQIGYIEDTLELCQGADVSIVDLVLEKEALEIELRNIRGSMHNGYYFVGDNVDMVTKVRHMTISNKYKDQHMHQMCAYENRVSGNNMDNMFPLQNADRAAFSQLIPSDKEKETMLQNFSFLVAKTRGKYMPYFTPFAASLPDFIVHPFIEQTRTKTNRVNMGVLKKNESKHDEMVDICQFLNKYVPNSADTTSAPVKILSGGDYLTFERHKQAQMSHRDQDTSYSRLEGLVPKMEEFHNQAQLMKVMWQLLYSTSSSRDIGTLHAARNITDSRNVSSDPAGNFYASSVMADKFTDAYIVAGAQKILRNEFHSNSANRKCLRRTSS